MFENLRERVEILRERKQRSALEGLHDLAEAAGQTEVAANLSKAAKAVPWASLIAALLPFFLQMLSGQPIDWAALAKVIADLLTPKQP